MKSISQIILFSLVVLAVKAQTNSYDTIPFALEYHHKRLEIFSQEPMTKDKIMFLGNSITQFGDWKNLLSDSTIINRGIAGDITYGVLHRLEDVIAYQPSKLFIKIGINDIAKNIPEDVISKNIFAIVQKVKQGSPNSQIYVHSILPVNDSVKTEYPHVYNKNENVRNVNRQLMRKAKQVGFVFIDLNKAFSDKQGKLDVRYADKDGLHLNPAGYRLWVAILKKKRYL